jgi:hypothetical protein
MIKMIEARCDIDDDPDDEPDQMQIYERPMPQKLVNSHLANKRWWPPKGPRRLNHPYLLD